MKHPGKVLVFFQFLGIGITGYAGMLSLFPIQPGGAGFVIAGICLGLYTLGFNKIGNFNIAPQPRAGGALVTTGPYRYIRHPMYTSVFLFLTGLTIQAGFSLLALAGLLLAAVAMLWKSTIEERLLVQRYPDYATYRTRTKRFIPFLI